uniref:USP domain-containing protein n=1 Tax=Panagrellus redivivus TaxID=6233 RepID=A0A7E4V3L8_PANRE
MDSADLGKRPSPTSPSPPDHPPTKQVRSLSERPSPFGVTDVTEKMMDGANIKDDPTGGPVGDIEQPRAYQPGGDVVLNDTDNSTDLDSDNEYFQYLSDQESSGEKEIFPNSPASAKEENPRTPSPTPIELGGNAELDRLLRNGLEDHHHRGGDDLLLNFANSADGEEGQPLPELQAQDINDLLPVEDALRPFGTFIGPTIPNPRPRLDDTKRNQFTRSMQRAANMQLFDVGTVPVADSDLDSDQEEEEHEGLCHHINLTLSIRNLSYHTDQIKGPTVVAYNGEWNIMAQFQDGLLGCFVQYNARTDDPRNGQYLCDVELWCKNEKGDVVHKKPLYHCFTGSDDFGFRNYVNDLTPIVGKDDDGRWVKIRARVDVLCRKPAGFRNSHVFCYMNSALQSLFSLPKFNRIILESNKKHKCIEALKTVMLQHHQSSKISVSPNPVYEHSKWNEDHHQFLQQDAQEFLRYFIDELEGILSETAQGPQITELFRGETSEYVNCLDVDYKSDKRDYFYDIQVNMIGPDGDLVTNFDDALKNYLTPTLLQGDNMYNCEGHGPQRAEKGVKFVKFPPVLNVYIMRYRYTDTGVEKISERFEFPKTVDLSNYMDKEIASDGDYRYELHTVLVHRGGGSGGHYCAIINIGVRGDHWVRFDDTNVMSCAQDAVYGDEDFTPYMLVYIKTSMKEEILRPLVLHEYTMPVEFSNHFYDYIDKVAFVTDHLLTTYGSLDLCTAKMDMYYPLHAADPFEITAASVYERACHLFALKPDTFRLWVYGEYPPLGRRSHGNRRPIELLVKDSNIPLARYPIFQRRYTFYLEHIDDENEYLEDGDALVFLKTSNPDGIRFVRSLIWKVDVTFKSLVSRMKDIAEMHDCERMYIHVDLSKNKCVHTTGPLDSYENYRLHGTVFILEDKSIPNVTCDTLERLAMTVRVRALQDNRFHMFSEMSPYSSFELDVLLAEKVHTLRLKIAEKIGVPHTRIGILRPDDKELLRDYIGMDHVFKIKDHDPRLGRVYDIHFVVLVDEIVKFKEHFIMEVHSGLFRGLPSFVNAFVDPEWSVAQVLNNFRQKYSISEDVALLRFNRNVSCYDYLYRNSVKLKKLKCFAKDHSYQLLLESMPSAGSRYPMANAVTVVVKLLDYGLPTRFMRFNTEEHGYNVRRKVCECFKISHDQMHRFEMRLMHHDGVHHIQSIVNDSVVDFANFNEETDGGLQRIDVWCSVDNHDLPELGMSPLFSMEEDEDSS